MSATIKCPLAIALPVRGFSRDIDVWPYSVLPLLRSFNCPRCFAFSEQLPFDRNSLLDPVYVYLIRRLELRSRRIVRLAFLLFDLQLSFSWTLTTAFYTCNILLLSFALSLVFFVEPAPFEFPKERGKVSSSIMLTLSWSECSQQRYGKGSKFTVSTGGSSYFLNRRLG